MSKPKGKRRPKHPLTARAILKEGFRLYRQNSSALILLSSLLAVPAVINYVLETWTGAFLPPNAVQDIINQLIRGVITCPLIALPAGALVCAATESYQWASPTIGKAVTLARARVIPLIAVGILAWIVLEFTPLVAMILIQTLIPAADQSTVYVLLFFLSTLAIASIGTVFLVMYTIRWSLIFQVVALEHLGAREALSRSSTLVKGKWWLAFRLYVLVLLCALPLFVAVWKASAALLPGEPWQTFLKISLAIAGILSGSLGYITSTILYHDLRALKEDKHSTRASNPHP